MKSLDSGAESSGSSRDFFILTQLSGSLQKIKRPTLYDYLLLKTEKLKPLFGLTVS